MRFLVDAQLPPGLARWLAEAGPYVVWLRVVNTSNVALKAWFVPRVPQIVALLAQGARLVEVR